LCWYVSPSYRQAKQILWGPLKSAIPSEWIARKSEIDLSITLKGYGSTIALRSADNPDSLRGSGLDLAILDEYSSMDPVTWHEVVRPALADKQGHAIIQGSPRGYNSLHNLYVQGQETAGWSSFRFSTFDGGLVSPEEIETIKATLDSRTFAQEFDASFEQSTSRVYLMFSQHNVTETVKGPDGKALAVEDYGGDLLVGIDFNVSPMSAVIAVKVADQLHIINELELHNSNTQELAEALKQKYPGRRLTAYPDPTGNSRRSSATAGVTDHVLLRQAGFVVRTPRGAYALTDKINTVNSMLMNAKGQRRLFIHKRCKRLIESLERFSYRDGSNIPDKSQGFDHLPDALAYLVCGEFPLTGSIGFARIRGF
jgi:hypothetical protein